jgi:hypothetical protein
LLETRVCLTVASSDRSLSENILGFYTWLFVLLLAAALLICCMKERDICSSLSHENQKKK